MNSKLIDFNYIYEVKNNINNLLVSFYMKKNTTDYNNLIASHHNLMVYYFHTLEDTIYLMDKTSMFDNNDPLYRSVQMLKNELLNTLKVSYKYIYDKELNTAELLTY